MNKKYCYEGNRFTHNGRRCTVTKAINEWVGDDYLTTSVVVRFDDDNSEITLSPSELTDDLTFFEDCDGYSHGHSNCKVYGITKEELFEIVKGCKNWDYVFLNGQEEVDCLSFDAYRMDPYEVVELFKQNAKAFVFAWWHWDGDVFDATDMTKVKAIFTAGPEEGDEEDWTLAEIKLFTDDEKSIEIGAGDFSEEEIQFYKNLS